MVRRLKQAKVVASVEELVLYWRGRYDAAAVEELVRQYRGPESEAEFGWKLGFMSAMSAYEKGAFRLTLEELEERYGK